LKNECFDYNLKASISIKSANFSWEGDASKPTLWSINLELDMAKRFNTLVEKSCGVVLNC